MPYCEGDFLKSRMNRPLAVALALIWSWSFSGQAAELVSIAGNGVTGSEGDGGPAGSARLNQPFGLIRAKDQSLWFADFEAHVVRRISREGTITTVIGTGTAGYAGDGHNAAQGQLNTPHEIRFNKAGDLFIADTENHVIRCYRPQTGRISTFAGTGIKGYSGDGGAATQAQFNTPISIQFDPAGDLFVADIGNHVLRKIDVKTGTISTFAGTGKPGPTPDGSPLKGAPLSGPRSIDFDSKGQLFLVTREGNQLFRIDRTAGIIHHLAGTGAKGFAGDGGPATAALLNGPKGLAVAPDGSIYLADTENHAIRRYRSDSGTIETVVGNGKRGLSQTADANTAALNRPHGVFVDADGTLLIGDSENHRIVSLPAAVK